MDIQNTTSISFKVGFNEEVHDDFEFVKPIEAPVFRPTEDEFALGPLEYIKRIRPLAQEYGICKVIPPSSFKPAFEVDPNKFMFKPRVQRINELEALTRAKLCFFEKIIKYWNLQGVSLKIPVIDRKIVDLYKLHRTVFEEGGFETCVREKKWMKIANKLYPSAPNKSTVGSLLRQHYERILYPYDIFASGASTGDDSLNDFKFDSNNNQMDVDAKTPIKQEQASSNNKRNLDDQQCENDLCTKKGKTGRTISRRSSTRLSSMSNSPAPISSSYTKMMNINDAISNSKEINSRTPDRASSSKIVCKLCNISREQDRSRRLLECDSCKDNFHLNCLIIPLNNCPRGKWNCPKCVANLVPKLPKLYTNEFGFAESRCKYTLNEFGEVADKFKRDYFGRELEDISCDLAEKEFWRLVTNLDDQCVVEYGADLHTNLVGSGFASRRNEKNQTPEYLDHPWNLNQLPLLDGSLFKYVNSNINGMIVPWIYVGMCFSTFCWHNEDHWTYSINYNHYGEPKTWYGINGDLAPQFEAAMAETAPELFEASPDLLHQLVTICNPNILQKKNVPIYRTNQHAGEFVITFPRSYHCGFNQGFNIAEAVNFAPADWLQHYGRQCMSSYTKLKRFPVFSQDELICNMSTDRNLKATLLSIVYDDLLVMVKNERNYRKDALEYGITKSQQVHFNTLPDDERQCDHCKTTCYLSALTCDCDDDKLVCLPDMKHLCKKCTADKFVLKYTFRLDELVTLLKNLEERLEEYDGLKQNLKKTIEFLEQQQIQPSSYSSAASTSSMSSNEDNKIDIKELLELKDKVEELNVPKNMKLVKRLSEHLDKIMYVQERINNFLDNNLIAEDDRLTMEEFDFFLNSLNKMNVTMLRQDELFGLFEEVSRMVSSLEKANEDKKPDSKMVNNLIDLNEKFNFLNLEKYLNGFSPAISMKRNKSPMKRKRNRSSLTNLVSPMKTSMKNSAF